MDEAINQFMAIADVSARETAHHYLELADQNIESALNLYHQDKTSQLSSIPGTDKTNERSESTEKNIKILQWNIQGLLGDCLSERIVAAVQEIKRLSPDVVMMQEVVLATYIYIIYTCQEEYKIYSPFDRKPAGYSTVLMVKASTFEVKFDDVITFAKSNQGRNLAVVSGVCCGKNVTVMTSHLESTASQAPLRMRQLIQVWKTMRDQDSSHTVVFGGDTNLRDREVTEVKQKNGKLASKVEDIWESLGSPKDARFSWDCSKNENQFKDSLARLRLGRLYMRSECATSREHFRPVSIEFIGMERLPCGMFPSDHWGILVDMTTEHHGSPATAESANQSAGPPSSEGVPAPLPPPPADAAPTSAPQSQGPSVNALLQDINKEADVTKDFKSTEQPACKLPATERRMSILQWNIQGSVPKHLKERIIAAVEEIRKYFPDIIILQEVKSRIKDFILTSFEDYESYFPDVDEWKYSMILVKKDAFQVHSKEANELSPKTRYRLLSINIWRAMCKESTDATVVFAGDVNVRDFEVQAAREGCPLISQKISDIWEKLGSPEDAKFTWDCTINDNQFQNIQAQLRFDRFYMIETPLSSSKHFHPTSMKLIGLERLPCGSFVSDHWGVLVEMKLPKPTINRKCEIQRHLSDKHMTVLQWNIQGTLETCLTERTVALVDEIKRHKLRRQQLKMKQPHITINHHAPPSFLFDPLSISQYMSYRLSPDVILMQDVVKDMCDVIKASCTDYELYCSFEQEKESKFNVIMTKQSIFQVKTKNKVKISSSNQKGDLSVVTGQIHRQRVTLMTSQLESNAFQAEKRINQFIQVCENMKKQSSMNTVLFGGDTSLKDEDVDKARNMSSIIDNSIDDIWEVLGSPGELQYTWDCSVNDNKVKNSQIKMRYGRVYMRRVSPMSRTQFHPKSMELVGMERLSCGSFISDHWGVLVTMALPEAKQV